MSVEEQVGTEQETTQVTTAPAGQPDFSAMSPQEIMEFLAQRRNQISEVTKVAKERGIELPKAKKVKVTVEPLEALTKAVDAMGYSMGMRYWAQSRILKASAQADEAITAVGELSDDQLEDLRAALAGGYQRAQHHTSFPSEVITKENKEPGTGAILPEFSSRAQQAAEGLSIPSFVERLID